MSFKITTNVTNAPKFAEWIAKRGGVLRWASINLGNIDMGWCTPALTESGNPYGKPTWEAEDKASIHATTTDEIGVAYDREVKRFRIGLRRGMQGFTIKVTDAGTRRIRAAVAKAGDGAYHVFDYATQEAVIMAPDKVISLTEWLKQQEGK